ncbi:MAG: hypothetical protein KDA24_12120 [Deltaproteobacteria bacterium]|nr:hypothetical protein [Deltaproteobacteria bacterium]
MTMTRGLTLLALLSGIGCVAGPGTTPGLAVDVELFAQTASPVVELHCGTSGCHGTPDRPYAVYARSEYRADPGDLLSDPPLNDDELRHNAIASLAFVQDVDDAAASALLRRPLHPAAGGSDHGGGAQFTNAQDPDYLVLAAWVDEVLR